MSEELFDEGLNEIEARLASLQWKASGIDRDRMMYLAGQASVSGSQAGYRGGVARWLWPLATAASLLLAVAMGSMMHLGKKPQTIERVVYVPINRSDDPTQREPPALVADDKRGEALPRADYLVLRWIALTQGVDALPEIHDTDAENVAPQQIYSRPIDFDFSG